MGEVVRPPPEFLWARFPAESFRMEAADQPQRPLAQCAVFLFLCTLYLRIISRILIRLWCACSVRHFLFAVWHFLVSHCMWSPPRSMVLGALLRCN